MTQIEQYSRRNIMLLKLSNRGPENESKYPKIDIHYGSHEVHYGDIGAQVLTGELHVEGGMPLDGVVNWTNKMLVTIPSPDVASNISPEDGRQSTNAMEEEFVPSRPPKILPVGSGYNADAIETQEINAQLKGTVKVGLEMFGNYPTSSEVLDVASKMTIAVGLPLLLLLSGVTGIAQEKVIQSIEGDSNGESNGSKPPLLSRRAFMLSAGAVSIYLQLSYVFNQLAINTRILGRRKIPAKVGDVFDNAVYELPAEILDKLDKRHKLLFQASMFTRNLGMVQNLFRLREIVAHATNLGEVDTINFFAGLFHMGVEGEYLKGPQIVEYRLRQVVNEVIREYKDLIEHAPDKKTADNELYNFLYHMLLLSVPVADKKIEIDPDINLPLSAQTIVWQEMEKYSAEVGTSDPVFARMYLGLAKAGYHVAFDNSLECDNPDSFELRGARGYTNMGEFDYAKPATLYLPKILYSKGANCVNPEELVPIVVEQNGAVYYFVLRYDLREASWEMSESELSATHIGYIKPQEYEICDLFRFSSPQIVWV